MTTVKAAEFLGRTDTMGTVDVGKDADIVLLRSDPTADVAHLHDVAGVVLAGRYYSPETLSWTIETIATAHSAV